MPGLGTPTSALDAEMDLDLVEDVENGCGHRVSHIERPDSDDELPPAG